jgi:hypothetical protein
LNPDIKNSLKDFQSILLSEMGDVKLMDRMDLKYTLSNRNLPLLLEKLKKNYKVLKIGDSNISTYKTLYFDTKNFDLYFKHHNGQLNRYKIRYRNYVESNLGFLEVKFRNNKGRMLKDRIRQNEIPLTWNETLTDFLLRKTPYQPDLLIPMVWVNYRRITFVGKETKERVTIDMNLEFSNNTTNKKLENLIIAEVKQPAKTKTPIIKILKECKIGQHSLSKYCLGMTSIYPNLKKNNFKEKLTALNKIINDKSFNSASGF